MDRIVAIASNKKTIAIFATVCAGHYAWLSDIEFIEVADKKPKKLVNVLE